MRWDCRAYPGQRTPSGLILNVDLHGVQRAGAPVGDGQAVVQIGGLRFLAQKDRILDVP